MSYLDTPRLHFAGTFTADPSTINNDINNYNPKNWNDLDVSWNPYGSHQWTVQCVVSGFVDQNGKFYGAKSTDPLMGASVTSISGSSGASAKLVDLDPDQQGRTRLYGFNIQIAAAGSTGSSLVQGHFVDTATLINLWFGRVPARRGDSAAGGAWQSVLENLKWGDISVSPFLQQVQKASPSGLSIRLSVYGFDADSTSPTFRYGKIVGTIGPSQQGAPPHIVAPSRLLSPGGNSPMWNAPAVVDTTNKRLTIDLGNSVPDQQPGGPPMDLGTMQAAIILPNKNIPIGTINYSQKQYLQTAGVSQLNLTQQQADLVASNPLGILIAPKGVAAVGLQENSDGILVQVDRASVLMNPGETTTVGLYASAFGQPRAKYPASIQLVQQQGGDNNLPPDGVSFPGSVTTDQNGRAPVSIKASNPIPKPAGREFVDGQLYFIGGPWASPADMAVGAPLTVKVFNAMKPIASPKWKDVQPILQQFYTLYAYMAGIVDLSNYDSVKANAGRIKSVMELSMSDPAYMPVTREMSRDATKLIIQWINKGAPA